MSSGGKGGAGSPRYNIFGTIAGAVGVGPFHRLTAFEVDDEVLWTADNVYRQNSPNPYIFDIPGRGTVYWYWGTDDQPACPVLQPAQYNTVTIPPSGIFPGSSTTTRISGNTLNHEHPSYSGIGYFVLKDFLFGLEKTTAPSIRVFVEREPQQTIVNGLPAALNDSQANPIAFAAEVLTSERAGLGWDDSMLIRSTFQAAADAANEAVALTGVSIRLDKQSPAKAAVVDMLDMCDGYLRADTLTGLLELGIYPRPEQIDTAALPLITSRHLTANPELKAETWEDVVTRWTATYTDRDKNYKERSIKYDDPRARYSSGSRRSETLSFGHVARAEQVRALLGEYARRRSVPGLKFNLTVLEAPFAALRPGAHVYADIDPIPGGEQLRKVFRVTEIVRRKQGDLKLTLEDERTLAPALYVPPVEDPGAPPAPAAPVADITHARLFECPPALADNQNYHVSVLASRPGEMVTNYHVYYDTDPGQLFPLVSGARNYALRARLLAPLAASAPSAPSQIPVELLDPINREILDENPGETAARDDTLLMFVIRADAASGQIRADAENKAWLEVFSIVESISTGENRLDIHCYRARLGTAPHEFSADDEVWFIRRAALPVIGHADFAALAANNAPAYFKLQPGETGRQRPLEDCAPRKFTFALARDLPEIADAWHIETRYRYQDIKPSAPAPVDTPAGWSLDRPETGAGTLWGTQARKRDGTNRLLGTWSDPQRVDGRRDFRQADEPKPATTDIRDGDLWFDTGDNNKLYRWDGTDEKWEGLFGLEADAFFTDPDTGLTYIKEAIIQKVSAGKITSGTIESAEIILAGEGAVIKTDDYEPGYKGSMINGKGAEFDRIVVRDTIVNGSLGSLAISPWFGQFVDTQAVHIAAPGDVTKICYTKDGSPPGPFNEEWPTSGRGFAPITLTANTRLRARGFGIDGRMTNEVDGSFFKAIPQADTVVISVNKQNSGVIVSRKYFVNLSCATPGRRIFFKIRSSGFDGRYLNWVIDNVGGPTGMSDNIDTGWYEWAESEKYAASLNMYYDRKTVNVSISAYAVAPDILNSDTSTITQNLSF